MSILDKTKGSTLPKYKHKTWTAKQGASNPCLYAGKIKYIFKLYIYLTFTLNRSDSGHASALLFTDPK